MKIFVRVKTNAKEEKIEALDETRFSIFVKALPVDGKANRAVAKALAAYFNTSPSQVELVSGKNFRQKVFEIL